MPTLQQQCSDCSGDMAYTKEPRDEGITLKHLFHLGPYQLYPGAAQTCMLCCRQSVPHSACQSNRACQSNGKSCCMQADTHKFPYCCLPCGLACCLRLLPGELVSGNPMLAGGEEEACAGLEEGLNAIFNLQLEHHCHLQAYLSSSDGTPKWAKIEMWPMMVCLFYCNVHFDGWVGFTTPVANAIIGHACMGQKHLSAELSCN